MTSTRKLAVAFAAARGLYGLGLIALPSRVGTSWLGPDAERAPVHIVIRGLGARDVALSVGTILAAANDAPLRPWLLGSLGCDLTDVASTLAVGDALPRRARIGTVALGGGSAAASAASGGGQRLVRIAVVGAGVSGLVCAHLLHEEHDLTVFEANDYAGGHTNTVRVDTEHETHHVDTGFIVHNDRNYPQFLRLLRRDRGGHPAVGDELLRERRPRGHRVQRLVRERAVREPGQPREPLVSPHGPRSAALQPRGPRAGGPEREWTEPGGVPPRGRLLARFRRAPDRAPGLRRVVGQTPTRCGTSRRACSPSSSTITACSA